MAVIVEIPVGTLHIRHIGRNIEYWTPQGWKKGKLEIIDHREDETSLKLEGESKLRVCAPEWLCKIS